MQTKDRNTGTIFKIVFTLVIAVNTFSKMALGWAFCGPLACILRPKAHGLAINLQRILKTISEYSHSGYCVIIKLIVVTQKSVFLLVVNGDNGGRHIDNIDNRLLKINLNA